MQKFYNFYRSPKNPSMNITMTTAPTSQMMSSMRPLLFHRRERHGNGLKHITIFEMASTEGGEDPGRTDAFRRRHCITPQNTPGCWGPQDVGGTRVGAEKLIWETPPASWQVHPRYYSPNGYWRAGASTKSARKFFRLYAPLPSPH
jgi:hypothetical protein